MRYVLALFIVLIGASLFSNSVRQEVSSLLETSTRELSALSSTKHVLISGLDFARQSEIQRTLPLDRSVFWWMLNSEAVESSIRQSPLVIDAKLSRCKGFFGNNWGCFEIAVKERTPGYIAIVDNEPWLVGKDGAFVGPAPKLAYRIPKKMLENLPLIQGIKDDTTSPDFVRSRLQYIRRVLETVKSEYSREIEEANFVSNGEIIVKFKDLNTLVRFDFVGDEIDKIRDEVMRLKLVLDELKENVATAQEIDLAYNRLAVVKFAEGRNLNSETKN